MKHCKECKKEGKKVSMKRKFRPKKEYFAGEGHIVFQLWKCPVCGFQQVGG